MVHSELLFGGVGWDGILGIHGSAYPDAVVQMYNSFVGDRQYRSMWKPTDLMNSIWNAVTAPEQQRGCLLYTSLADQPQTRLPFCGPLPPRKGTLFERVACLRGNFTGTCGIVPFGQGNESLKPRNAEIAQQPKSCLKRLESLPDGKSKESKKMCIRDRCFPAA